ncbi:sigma-70 family RNA polymerase sigma factor [Paenibacillus sp. MER 180]|uniref:sigma-70 family RNA polymerase sigma factor n=1 Tax=Paenibacillus sp. MER 180 TaxID=2939570 RepID=UPI00203ACD8F|nr:sigma-70 family RNA polymerase sigma factor [Paenibacillus sp. MER 180]MCM3288877.1 sigma-70 family RNA polymerase sigma factor [Paenibacillus sp. MER 180]
MNEQEWNRWIDRLIEGDIEAFEVIYSVTKQKVYGTVSMLVSNREDVNDIVSNIYCKLWQALPSYDRTRPFLFWLNGIVIRQVQDWRRQIWRRFRLLERNRILDEKRSPDPPDELLIEQERQSELLTLINKMPYKLRVVVIYRYYCHYTNEDIAELLSIPVGTVKSRNHLALKQLRRRFGTQLEREGVIEHVYFKRD